MEKVGNYFSKKMSETYHLSLTVEKNENFINSSQNEGLSPSYISLSFDGFGSISWHSVLVFRLSNSFYILIGFPTFSA
jgi:hypothetical protein